MRKREKKKGERVRKSSVRVKRAIRERMRERESNDKGQWERQLWEKARERKSE